jgi:hypothetical protein
MQSPAGSRSSTTAKPRRSSECAPATLFVLFAAHRVPRRRAIAGVHGDRRSALAPSISYLSEDFRPFRIDVVYLPGQPAPIKPLIAQLTFIRSKTH